jgi:aerobic-type carbon monoxide dehydrogenase small subunit (CoxS/CutS family)
MSGTPVTIEVTCNGGPRRFEAPPERLLVDALREELLLTGTKLGCGTGDCGACTVLLDGQPVTSCLVYAVECDGRAIDTVEGVSKTPAGQAVVDAFVAEGAVQCGICTPGLVVAATALLDGRDIAPATGEIKDALAGNLCRCTGYFPIVRAVEAAGRRLSAERAAS